MKAFMTLCALSIAFSSQLMASNLKTVEGKVAFEKGQYFIAAKNSKLALTGLSLQQLRQYEGRSVKVAGDLDNKQLEIYKVFVKADNGYEASYDWEVVNQDLYAD